MCVGHILMSTASLKNDSIRIHNECEGRIEKSVPRITIWHHEACRVMTNGDHHGFFYPTPTRIMDSFSCSPLFLYFKISFSTLRYNFYMMTSLEHNNDVT